MFWIIVENWKSNDVFNTLADKTVKHCVVKKISDLLVVRLLGTHGSAPGGFRQAECVSRR